MRFRVPHPRENRFRDGCCVSQALRRQGDCRDQRGKRITKRVDGTTKLGAFACGCVLCGEACIDHENLVVAIASRGLLVSCAFKRSLDDASGAQSAGYLDAYAARFARSMKDKCLSRMIFVGQGSLRCAVVEYLAHHHAERNHLPALAQNRVNSHFVRRSYSLSR